MEESSSEPVAADRERAHGTRQPTRTTSLAEPRRACHASRSFAASSATSPGRDPESAATAAVRVRTFGAWTRRRGARSKHSSIVGRARRERGRGHSPNKRRSRRYRRLRLSTKIRGSAAGAWRFSIITHPMRRVPCSSPRFPTRWRRCERSRCTGWPAKHAGRRPYASRTSQRVCPPYSLTTLIQRCGRRRSRCWSVWSTGTPQHGTPSSRQRTKMSTSGYVSRRTRLSAADHAAGTASVGASEPTGRSAAKRTERSAARAAATRAR